jgi:hypothetical protein
MAKSTTCGMTSTMSAVPMVPATNEPDGRRGQGLRGPARLGHLVALEGGDDRCRFTGGVEQDRRRRAAVHAAVEDAGEQDERLLDGQAVGEWQQQRDRHGGADTGQHAHGRADEHAEGGR